MTLANVWSHVSALSWGDMATWAGVGVTWLLARNARGAATDAEKIRNEIRGEIAERNAYGELSNLYGLITKVIERMDKYGPGAGADSRRGSKPNDDATSVRELTTQLAVHGAMLEERFIDIEQIRVRLADLLDEFSAEISDTGRVMKGRAIHSELTGLCGNIKKELDRNIYG